MTRIQFDCDSKSDDMHVRHAGFHCCSSNKVFIPTEEQKGPRAQRGPGFGGGEHSLP